MTLRLWMKCEGYYQFSRIRVVIITRDSLTIVANFEKGKKYKEVILKKEMLRESSLKKFMRFCEDKLTVFHLEGCCPHCKSTSIYKYSRLFVKELANVPNAKKEVLGNTTLKYFCDSCHKELKQLESVDIIEYHKR